MDGKFAYYLLREKMDGCGYTSAPCTPYPVKNDTVEPLFHGGVGGGAVLPPGQNGYDLGRLP